MRTALPILCTQKRTPPEIRKPRLYCDQNVLKKVTHMSEVVDLIPELAGQGHLSVTESCTFDILPPAR